MQLTLLYYHKHGSLPTRVMMFRVSLAFIPSCWPNRRRCLCVYQKLLHIDRYGQFFSVPGILWDQCGKCFAFKQLHPNYHWCYRPPNKSKIPEFTIKLNEILSTTSQCDNVLRVRDLNMKLLDHVAIENYFVNNCHSNCLFHLIKKLKTTRNANNNPSILDHKWTNQLCDTFNDIFLLNITDHYRIFTIATINCPRKRNRVKFRDHSGVEHFLNNHVQIN